ncbi:TetR/AcrR family transcriptional regulator [Leuconostoc suionicum]|uniref:TetR/AcrR family transcriptional regulator n=1 Tax=Leuconostoc suionicum TaxID=1511761 RepID=UPI00233F5253|nr:TetR/AcrR family transcriptional regulator [Leuconostoc suionicum]MDC2805181.1 TetR/AcrR family transcriptional regulator [Leuconostoc suionicum]MDC2817374.1 TetR/AcrR family transcriptional regulator [Leuconostoc suionicum]MDC2822693.1 TetR/AcrR family transcriptional regulator [Leuconostoc suionicum]
MKNIRDYQKTHKKLLQSGLTLFLKANFETTSVRQICKLADVTTGAFYKHFTSKEDLLDELIEPYLLSLKKIYDEYTNVFQMMVFNEGVQNSSVLNNSFLKKYWEQNTSELDPIIDYMYLHPEITKLVLFKSNGSQYENILEKITIFSETRTIETIKWLKQKKLISKEITGEDDQLHFFIYSYLATILDILMHEYSLEKTKKLMRDVYSFQTPSWINYLLNIKC